MKISKQRLKRIIKEEIQEAHILDNAPDEFEVPDISNPNAKKFVVANNISMDRAFLDQGYEGWDASGSKTCDIVTTIDVDRAKQFEGQAGENRRWEKRGSGWWFGNYPLSEWQEFVNSVAENGLDWPITIKVNEHGVPYLYEGNHRLAAYDVLGIPEIPVNVWWYGNVQGTERDQLSDLFFEEFGRKDYFWI